MLFRPRAPRPHGRGRVLALSVVTALVAGAIAAPAAWSAASLLPVPKAPVAQPALAEPMQPYVPQTSCDPRIKPGVKRFRDLMLATYPRGYDGGSTRVCTAGGTSEHYEGRAWDWMLSASDPKDRKVADAAIAWLLAPGPDGKPALQARRLGVMYIMFNHRIWGTWDNRWKPISAGSDQHTTHIHLSFSWAGAEGRTSFWTGKVGTVDYGPCAAYRGQPARIYSGANPKPCPTNLPSAPKVHRKVRWTGSTGAAVRTAQVMLGIPVASRSTTFGTTLRNAVVAYQRTHRLPVTGALDKATWWVLDPAKRYGAAPAPAPTPTPTPTPIPTPTPTPTTTTSSGNASALPAASTWVTQKLGMSGPRVLSVQKALRLTAANRTGYFGPVTLAAVKAFQAGRHLTADGVVGPRTAKALGLVA